MKFAIRTTQILESPTLAVTAKVQAKISQGLPVIAFTAGQPHLLPPDQMLKALADNANQSKYTPASGVAPLREKVAQRESERNGRKFKKENISVAAGVKPALTCSLMCLVNPGDKVLLVAPFWPSYREIVIACGGIPIVIQTNATDNYRLTTDLLKQAFVEHGGSNLAAIILNSPSNPSGIVYTKDEFLGFADVIRTHAPQISIISDEIYEDILHQGQAHFSLLGLAQDLNVVKVSGWAKGYAAPGWRIGYAVGTEEFITRYDATQSQLMGNPPAPQQYAVMGAFDDHGAFPRELSKIYQGNVQKASELFEKAQIPFIKPQGAFYFSLLLGDYVGAGKKFADDWALADYLLENFNVGGIPLSPFGGPAGLRLSLACDPNLVEEGMNRIIAGLKSLR
ncbi:aminotransferase class I/II-fold pyridoxal phosphate-dependent enzyme [bacterium]|nr:aminotransferase class I/II-fold pyridoxal phosphate-dependent enzyme [bacterium]